MDYTKISMVSRLGSRFCSKLGLVSEHRQFVDLLIKAQWGRLFHTFNIDFRDVFLGQNEDHEKVLQEFIEKSTDNPDLSKNMEVFSKAFGPIPLYATLELLIKTVLTSPALEPTVDDGTEVPRVNRVLFDQAKSQVDRAVEKLP